MNVAEPLPLIIIHYNTPELLARCLHQLASSIRENDTLTLDVTIVDTSPEAIRKCVQTVVEDFDATFADITLLMPPNHSMANAVNVGLKYVLKTSTSPVIAHMNADVFVSLSVLANLKQVLLQDDTTAMVGPVCMTAEGNLQPQGLLYHWHYLWTKFKRCVRVPWLSGCLQMIKREAVEAVGGMNSSYRFYNEDMEWCLRLRRAGWTCKLVNMRQFEDTSAINDIHAADQSAVNQSAVDQSAVDQSNVIHSNVIHSNVIHLGGSSTPDNPAFIVEGFRGGYRLSQQYRHPLYQTFHRLGVYGYSSYQARSHHRLEAKQGYTQVAQLLKHNDTLLSKFGSTLDKDL
jgi:GT2 family glycosyltransferase